jgi:hypothetical protein
MMKGADAALYSVCLALNLKTQARPVYITSNSYYEDEEKYEDDEDNDWPPKRQKRNPESLFPGVKAPPLPPKDKVNDDWIGDKFRIITPNESMGDLEQSLLERLEREVWLHEYKGIQWVNKPKHKEANRCYMTVFHFYISDNLIFFSMAMNLEWDCCILQPLYSFLFLNGMRNVELLRVPEGAWFSFVSHY